MSKPASYLEDIRQSRIKLRNLELDIHDDVMAARNAGSTWQDIGDALAITKQAAQQRYTGKPMSRADTTAGHTPSIFSS